METSAPMRILIITGDESVANQIRELNSISTLIKLPDQMKTAQKSIFNREISSGFSTSNISASMTFLTCTVCGASATGYNFGAIACESCKAFFRRSCRKDSMQMECLKTNSCSITIDTRRHCPACRLQKCFQCGMQRDRLGKYKQKQTKKHGDQQCEMPKSRSQYNTEGSTNRVLSTLNFDDVNTSEIHTLESTNLVLSYHFLDCLSPTLLQYPKVLLNSEEFQRIQNIETLYYQRLELAIADGLPWDPSVYATTFLDTLNSQSTSVMRLLAFFKQIPEFQQLPTNDKVILIKHNLLAIVAVNTTLAYNTKTNQILETDRDSPWNFQFFQILHGFDVSNRVKKIYASFLKIRTYDPQIIRLALIKMIFTKRWVTNETQSNLSDDFAIHQAQNYYTELMWKYVESKYGSQEAAKLFSQLVVGTLAYQKVEEEMRNNIKRVLSPQDIDLLVPIMKSLLCIS